MNTMRSILYLAMLTALVSACRPANLLVPQPDTNSMKGYELYCWQEDGQWFFSLLVGTNREKSLNEIHSIDMSLKGMEELQPVLESIPAGQIVTWMSGEGLAFPPDETIRKVEQICRDQGLEFSLVEWSIGQW